MIELRTLGTIDLRAGDGRRIESVLQHTKRISLLAYLCASHPPRLHRRATLVALLWPDSDEAHARGALRHELSQLRRSLGPGVLLGEGGESVGVDADRLWCDVRAFEAALADDRAADALRLWGGEFLPGLQVDGGEFERWMDETRGYLTRRAIDATRALTAAAEEAGDLKAAVTWARRQTQLAPWDETGWQRLIAVLDRQGDRAGALAAYEDLASLLREEMEVDPSPETRALVERIRGRGEAFAIPTGEGGALRPRHSAERPAAPATDSGVTPALPGSEDPVPGGPVRSPAPRRSLRKPLRWVAAAAPILVVLVIASRSMMSVGDDRAVIELPSVENQTGDTIVEPVRRRVADRLAEALVGTEFVEVVAPGGKDRLSARLTAVLYRRGNRLEVRARLVAAGPGGTVLAVPPPVLVAPEDPDPALDTLVATVLAAVATHFDPRFDASGTPGRTLRAKPPSWEAYLEYVRGSDLFGYGDFDGAAEHLLKSYRLGYDKAAVFGAAALAWGGNPTAADSLASTMLARDTLGDYERAFARWLQANLHGHRPEAYRAARDYERAGAGASPSAILTAGMEALAMNRPREAIRHFERVDVGHGWLRHYTDLWASWAGAYHMMGNHHDELSVALDGRGRFPESLAMIGAEIRARAALGETDQVRRLVEEALTLPPGDVTPADLAWIAAQELAAHGREGVAADLRGVALGWLEQQKEPTTGETLLHVRLLLETGDVGGARRLLGTLPPQRDLDWLALTGIVSAQCGDTATAREAVERLEGISNPYLAGRHLFLASSVRLALGDREAALRTLRSAFAAGQPFGVELHALPMLRPLADGHELHDLIRPRG